MPKQERFADPRYRGVFYIWTTSPATGKPEKKFYIRYKKDGHLTEEPVGTPRKDAMSFSKASRIRGRRIDKKQKTNEERREEERQKKKAVEDRWTLSKLWGLFEKTVQLKGMKSLECLFRLHIKVKLGEKTPAELQPLDLERLQRRMRDAGRAPATIKQALGLIRRMANFGQDSQLCEGLTFRVRMPRLDNEKTDFFSDDELNRLVMAFGKTEDRQIAGLMSLALYSGLRRGELFRLRWSDIDLERGLLTIRQPKGGSTATIPISAKAKNVLEKHPRTKGSPYVFPGAGGKQRQCCNRAARKIMEAAKLEGIRPLHSLRHHFASCAANSGTDLYTISRLLNHSTISMTKRYAHLADSTLKDATEAAAAAVDEQLARAEAEKADNSTKKTG